MKLAKKEQVEKKTILMNTHIDVDIINQLMTRIRGYQKQLYKKNCNQAKTELH